MPYSIYIITNTKTGRVYEDPTGLPNRYLYFRDGKVSAVQWSN